MSEKILIENVPQQQVEVVKAQLKEGGATDVSSLSNTEGRYTVIGFSPDKPAQVESQSLGRKTVKVD